jgi:hypothetical protein
MLLPSEVLFMTAFLSVRCPACKTTLRVAVHNAERPVRCPPCGRLFQARRAASQPARRLPWKVPALLCVAVMLAGSATAGWSRIRPASFPSAVAPPAPSSKAPTPAVSASPFEKDVVPLVEKYCVRCHKGAKPKGGVALDRDRTEADAVKHRILWEKVNDNLRSGEMPPSGAVRPTAAEMEVLNRWFDVVLGTDCAGPRDPGRVTIRRLNRAEYNNTIRDLLGVEFQPARDFPADDVGYGFDNIGDVLSLPPLLMEKYLSAAEDIVAGVFKDPKLRDRILTRKPGEKGAAQQILQAFATRAYRRPAGADEVRRLLGFVKAAQDNRDGPEVGIRNAVTAVLVSPHFLFRVELDRGGTDGASTPVNEWELASRLSYFLWSSMPDEELFRHAREKTLRNPGVLEGQVRRMLKDAKSQALADNFAAQWLQTRSLENFAPDPTAFPGFDEGLRRAMMRETELFFLHIVRENRSILEFLDADYTFADRRLALFYDLDGVIDMRRGEFRKVSLAGTQRGGVLTQASVLAVTSNPTRTSPVKRGKFILDNILGTPPPPPPPDVEQLKEDGGELKGTLRQRMEQHRANPTCASCHQRMDPLGFGFENFNAIGAWRTEESKSPIDPSGVLPDGASFKGPAELRRVLLKKKDQFARCLTEKMFTYALGRGVERSDRCFVEGIATALAKAEYKFSNLVIEIVKSDPFEKRGGKGGR